MRKVTTDVNERLQQALQLEKSGSLQAAKTLFKQIVKSNPRNATAISTFGLFLTRHFDRCEGEALIHRAVACSPSSPGPYVDLGFLALAQARPDDALEWLNAALSRAPDDAIALHNRGIALHRLQRPEEAVASHRAALPGHPSRADVYADLGLALRESNEPQQAIDAFRHSLALNPQNHHVRFALGQCRLLVGDYAQGFDDYEWRATLLPGGEPSWFRLSRLQGNHPLQGSKILLRAEQGFGDTIQFARYASLLLDQGALVTMQVQQPLVRLMENISNRVSVIGPGDPPPLFDRQIPLLSLPRLFGTRTASIPASPAYLAACPERSRAWSERLGPKHGLRVGIAWSGRPTFVNDRTRSMSFDLFSKALDPAFDLVSIQRDIRETDQEQLAAHSRVRHFGPDLTDFAETAALIAQMDLVVTTDTSVAHLAAALGRPTWILLSHVPDWRWGLTGEETPWYPSARLFRQTERGQWNGPLDSIRAALGAWMTRF